jgi:hypothetical protein
MEQLIKEVREQDFATKEYLLGGSDAKAIECVPMNGISGKEQTIVTSLNDLNVSILFHFN